jgi:hypothetical protein
MAPAYHAGQQYGDEDYDLEDDQYWQDIYGEESDYDHEDWALNDFN